METEKKTSSKKQEKPNKNLEKVQELEKQIEELKNDYLRSVADFENYKKRKEKEILEIKDKAIVDFVLEILPSIDNFEMSLKMTENKEMFIKGVEMIHKNLNESLKTHKIEEFIAKENDNFDPHLHEPILVENKNKKAGTIIATIKKGYKHKNQVIRPALVQVVKEHDKKEK